jgi:hypothetical protein
LPVVGRHQRENAKFGGHGGEFFRKLNVKQASAADMTIWRLLSQRLWWPGAVFQVLEGAISDPN